MSEKVNSEPIELGHLIDKLPDGRSPYSAPELVDWFRSNPPGADVHNPNMMGEVPITLDGEPARIGWMKIDGTLKTLNAYPVECDERFTVIEGSVEVKLGTVFIPMSAPTEIDPKPDFQSIVFFADGKAQFRDPHGPSESRCWYLFTPI
jgi:hypothetical protein